MTRVRFRTEAEARIFVAEAQLEHGLQAVAHRRINTGQADVMVHADEAATLQALWSASVVGRIIRDE